MKRKGPTHRLIVKLDRRADAYEALVKELRDFGDSIANLDVELADRSEFEAARDAGKFRDFVAVGALKHQTEGVLDWVVEELIDRFGWLVDFARSCDS